MTMKHLSIKRTFDQTGVTLVELLIALALSLTVLIGLSAVYVTAKQSFRFQENSGQLQEDANYALDTLAKDIRMAGFGGCKGVDVVANPTGLPSPLVYYPQLGTSVSTAYDGPNPLGTVFPADATIIGQPLLPTNFIRGFDATVPSLMFSAGSVPVSSTTDSLFVSGGSSKAVSINAPQGSSSAALEIGTDSQGWGTTDLYNMIVSDCTTSSLFIGQIANNAGVYQIQHGGSLGSATIGTNAAGSFPINPVAAPPAAPVYGVDSLVMPLEWNFYYVATRNGASTPSLYRVFYDGSGRKPASEIVANVESMRLQYAENLNGIDSGTAAACVLATGGATCIASLQADVWRTTAATVTDWSRVVAVRVGLMMVSAEDNVNADVTLTVTPTLLGSAYTIPAGATKRLRKEFSTTVVLRNRITPR